MSENCKYRLPCGWCDRQNKQCEMVASAIATDTVTRIDVTEKHYDTTISSITKKCGSCEYANDSTINSTSMKTIICQISGKFHFVNDVCDCNTITVTG